MKSRIRAAILYFLFVIVVVVVIFLNYTRTTLTPFISDLPSNVLPIASSAIVVLLVVVFWLRERAIEEREYQFITIVTHKFRTPLTGIKWAIDEFKKEVTHEEKVDILKQMENSSNKLMEIVDILIGFVKFNKKLEYAFEASSLHEMIQESLEKYGQKIREKAMHFNIQMDQDVPLIVVDRRKIQFVIDMLVDNAIKYTPQGGTITAGVVTTKNSVLVSVTDTGMGMSMFDLTHVFKKFYRSKEAKTIDTEGMGMGLHTAQVIMHHHGGRIWATSPGKDKGATFHVELPYRQ
ncbi:MAG: HAMP domain-containing histidine kinase [bacterium]|nr:HAMP domain-containing histidine kinase [bacterium]